MNYYPFHIGDYAAHTQRLSLMEDLAYRRMIDAYYLDERPFNGCSSDVARAIGMLDHMEAVEYVLGKFFQHDENGFSNNRCDEEIAHFHDKQAKASNAGRASAERRLKQKSTSVEKQATDVQLTKNQEPITNNHKKNTESPPEGVTVSVWTDFKAIRKAKRAALTDTALKLIRDQAEKSGYSLQQALEICCERGWASFNPDWLRDSAKAIPVNTKAAPGKHFGFQNLDYTTGINQDGTFN